MDRSRANTLKLAQMWFVKFVDTESAHHEWHTTQPQCDDSVNAIQCNGKINDFFFPGSEYPDANIPISNEKKGNNNMLWANIVDSQFWSKNGVNNVSMIYDSVNISFHLINQQLNFKS